MRLLSAFIRGLYAAARLLADFRAIFRTVETGSPMPIVRRGFNKLWGRIVISKLWWKGR